MSARVRSGAGALVRARMSFLASALVALVAFGASPAAAQRVARNEAAHAGDRWYGEDKVRHFAASAGITAISYGGARAMLDSDEAVGAAIGAAAVAGLVREIHDYRLGKPFSFKDLAWDALGVAVGYVWIREIE